MKDLRNMKEADVSINANIIEEGGDYVCTVDLQNNADVVAFFMELQLLDPITGQTILPVFWDDNYVSLIPGESKTIVARVAKANTTNGQPVFKYKGVNVK